MLERERRSYLNRVGRIVEGYIVEIVDNSNPGVHPFASFPISHVHPLGVSDDLSEENVAEPLEVAAHAVGRNAGSDVAGAVAKSGGKNSASVNFGSNKTKKGVESAPEAASKAGLKTAPGVPPKAGAAVESVSAKPASSKVAPSKEAPSKAVLPAVHRSPTLAPNGGQRLLYYSYSISGVTYETAQDVTGMEERIHMSRVAAGQTASVKYDPANPSNSILLSDDWSGLH